jgi:hypothetical protein
MSNATCPHGFTPAECLICRTLGTQPQVQVETGNRPTAGPAPPPGLAVAPAARPARSDPARSPDGPGRPPRSHGTHVALVVAGLVAIGVVAWIVVSVVFTLLHVIELLLVAALAGWVGYRVGYFRGRRHREP